MHGFLLFTHIRNRFLLPGALAVCAAAACPAATAAPVLTGVPPTSVTVGGTYSFQPGSHDSLNKAIIGWSIHNKPAWATFNIKTGLLTGKPTSAQVGTYSSIQIYGSDGTAWATTPVFSVTVKATSTSATSTGAPVLTGVPPKSVTVGSTYSFQPGSDDSQNKRILGWAIHNKPAWATFNTKTGLLTGKPTSAQVGTYSSIQILGSDGVTWAATSAFSITVESGTTTSGTGTATLGWTAPTENTNGTALTDLAGYRVHYGTSASSLSTTVQVPGASVKSYTLKNLGAATYYFGVTAYTTTGVESAMSKVVSKAVN